MASGQSASPAAGLVLGEAVVDVARLLVGGGHLEAHLGRLGGRVVSVVQQLRTAQSQRQLTKSVRVVQMPVKQETGTDM